MNITEQKERNADARDRIKQVVQENGLKWLFIADKLQIHISNLSHWKANRFMFGKEKLEQVEALIRKYNNIQS